MKAKDLVPETSVAAYEPSGRMISLESEVQKNVKLEPVPGWTTPGRDVYRRGLILVLDMAVRRTFPESRLWVEHALSLGYKCRLGNRPSLSAEEITERLTDSLSKIVKEDLILSFTEVKGLEEYDFLDECSYLSKWRNPDRPFPFNSLGESSAFAMGPAIPRTSWLKTWELRPQGSGFVLRFPGSASWPDIGKWEDRPKLAREFELEEKHGARMRVRTIYELNQRICEDGGREVVIMSHFYQQYKMVQIVMALQASFPQKRIVTIAGPSSSGKTTLARLLNTSLRAQGFGARTISLDNYFENRDATPRDKSGNYDFECIQALNTELLGKHLAELLEGREVLLPKFDFHSGNRQDSVIPMKLDANEFLFLEGIHGLNDDLTPGIDPSCKYRIYISALTQLNIDRLTRMSTSDSRLIRRMVRDSVQRGYSAEETIRNWPSVRRGERKNIFPFQEHADAMFNSALSYELSVLKPYAEPLLLTVEPGSDVYNTAYRLLNVLAFIKPIDDFLVPRDSLLREFIGGSIFKEE